MKRVHFEVRSEEIAEDERFLTLREAREFVEANTWGSVAIVRITVEDVPLKPRAKKRLTLFEGAKLMPSSVLVSTSPLKPVAKRKKAVRK